MLLAYYVNVRLVLLDRCYESQHHFHTQIHNLRRFL